MTVQGDVMRAFRLAACRTLRFATAMALCSVAHATDGFYDTGWANSGYFSFSGSFVQSSTSSFAAVVRKEANGNVIALGNLGGGGWWLADLTSGGSFVPTFGASDGSGRTTSCQILGACGTAGAGGLVPLGDGRYLILGAGALTRTSVQAHASELSVPVDSFTINDVQGTVAAYRLALQTGGNVFLAGDGHYSAADTRHNAGLARLTSQYALDTTFHAVKDNQGTTFSGGTIVVFDAASNGDYPTELLLQNDQPLLIGYSHYDVSGSFSTDTIRVARLNGSNGSLDPGFGSGGIASASIDAQSGHAVLDRAGRIVVAASTSSGFGFVRFSANGTPELQNLVSTIGLTALQCNGDFAADVAIDSAGRILVAGTCGTLTQAYFLVLRFRGDTGALDPSFGLDGQSYGYFDGNSKQDAAQSIILDTSNRPVLIGDSFPGSQRKVGAARLAYDLVFTDGAESAPRGCLPPNCN